MHYNNTTQPFRAVTFAFQAARAVLPLTQRQSLRYYIFGIMLSHHITRLEE